MSEEIVNPWGSDVKDNIIENNDQTGFSDNFVPSTNDSDKLPDHEEYLSKLENRLNNLKKKSSIAKELAFRRSDEARRMLESNAAMVELFEDEDLDENSAISRRLFPEKQALTMSEIAKLLESDSLAKEENTKDTAELTEESPKI